MKMGAVLMRWLSVLWLVLAAALIGAVPVQAREEGLPQVALAALPPQAAQTLALIKQGGPYPYKRDGITFHNREKRLPAQPRGYYREYTVPTPGLNHRGAKRIVAGRGGEFYYTADHYKSFMRIRE